MLPPHLRMTLALLHRGTDEATVERLANAYAMFRSLPEDERAKLVADLVAAWLQKQGARQS